MSVLKVILIGNLGSDPESRTFQDGSMVTNLSVAHSEKWKDKSSGENKERVEWCRVVLRDRGNYKLGQMAAQYLQKGSKVYIEGSLRTRKWTDKANVDHYTTEIIADNMQMLDRPDNSGQKPSQPQRQQASGNDFGDFDNDIPFSNYELRTIA